jgi:hypothetical protein
MANGKGHGRGRDAKPAANGSSGAKNGAMNLKAVEVVETSRGAHEPDLLLPGTIRQQVAAGSVHPGALVRCRLEHARAPDADKQGWETLFLQARDAYVRQHGALHNEIYNIHATGAAGLLRSKDGFVFLWVNGSFPGCSAVEDLVSRLDSLADQALALDDTPDRDVLLGRIASLGSMVTDLWASHAGKTVLEDPDKHSIRDGLAVYEKELRRVEGRVAAVASRQAKVRYLRGVLYGLAVLLPAAVLWQRLAPFLPLQVSWVLLASALFGTLGGAVSAAMRMARPSLRMDLKAGPGLIMFSGGLRPVLGGVFGGLFYVFVKGDLIPVKEPAEPATAAFFVGAAFLMGFSERLVRDILLAAGNRVTPGSEGDKPEGRDDGDSDKGDTKADGKAG